MMVVRQNFRDAEFAADVHRNTIGQTIAFVETRFVKLQTFQQCRFGVRDNIKINIFQNITHKKADLPPQIFAIFAEKVQNFN